MDKSISSKIQRAVSYVVLLCGVFLIIYPFYLSLITALKTPEESARDFFALPHGLYMGNFLEVFNRADYLVYVRNSVVITGVSVIVIMIFVPLCAYGISRNMERGKYYKVIYYYMLAGIFVPFQVIMVPLIKYLSRLKLCNTTGLIVMSVTMSISEGIFLLVNYIRSVPRDLEESAYIDGCSTIRSYVYVILPLIKPMLATLFVLEVLWIWNDFQMPLMILNQSQKTWTLPLFQYNFKSKYTYDYNLAFASYLIAMVPVLIAYVFGQKYIVSGLTQGAVKS